MRSVVHHKTHRTKSNKSKCYPAPYWYERSQTQVGKERGRADPAERAHTYRTRTQDWG